MGATVQYHPVSLTVLRAGAINAGFRFSTIKQTYVSVTDREAAYVCLIEEMPDEWYECSLRAIGEALQGGFARDVWVVKMWFTREGTWYALINVHPKDNDAATIERQERMKDVI